MSRPRYCCNVCRFLKGSTTHPEPLLGVYTTFTSWASHRWSPSLLYTLATLQNLPEAPTCPSLSKSVKSIS